MTERTIIDKLRSYQRHKQGGHVVRKDSWGISLHRIDELPDPQLPDIAWLESVYLHQIAKTAPNLLAEATELVAFVRQTLK